MILQVGLTKLHVAPVQISSAQVNQYVASNPTLVATLNIKLERLPGIDIATRDRLRDTLLKEKLIADNTMEEIRGHHPGGWESIRELRSAKETGLAFECSVTSAVPNVLLQDTVDGYKQDLIGNLMFLNDADAIHIALGTTADWMAECPLTFKTLSA